LSKISRLDIAKKKNLPSFPITNPVNYVNMSNEDNNNNNNNGILPRVHSLDEPVAPVQEYVFDLIFKETIYYFLMQ